MALWFAVLAVTALGAAAAPLNPAYTSAEVAVLLADSAARMLIVQHGGSVAMERRGDMLHATVCLPLAAGFGRGFRLAGVAKGRATWGCSPCFFSRKPLRNLRNFASNLTYITELFTTKAGLC